MSFENVKGEASKWTQSNYCRRLLQATGHVHIVLVRRRSWPNSLIFGCLHYLHKYFFICFHGTDEPQGSNEVPTFLLCPDVNCPEDEWMWSPAKFPGPIISVHNPFFFYHCELQWQYIVWWVQMRWTPWLKAGENGLNLGHGNQVVSKVKPLPPQHLFHNLRSVRMTSYTICLAATGGSKKMVVKISWEGCH